MKLFPLQPNILLFLLSFTALSFAFPSENIMLRKGKDFALFIAVDRYDNWKDLRNPVRDAEAIAKELRDRYQFEIEVVANPSKRKIFQKLEEYARKTYAEDDQLFLFFSGHGHYRDQGSEGFFIPPDAESVAEDPYGDTFFVQVPIKQLIFSIFSSPSFLFSPSFSSHPSY